MTNQSKVFNAGPLLEVESYIIFNTFSITAFQQLSVIES